jgi:uncharacterized membrane protein
MTTKSTHSSSILLALFAAMAMGTGTAKAGYTTQVLTVPDLPAGDSLSVSQISSDGKLILLTAFNPTTYYTDACYVYNRATHKVSTLPVDPDAVPGSETYAGINSQGHVVGNELSTTGTVPEWAATQGYQPFQAFAYDPSSGIYYNFNAAREIEPGGINCQANGINDLGQIAGVYENGGGEQGFILANIRVEHIKQFYKTIDALPQGRIQMSPTFEGYTGGRTQPQAINILGDVVGYYTDANTVATIGTQAFIYDPKKGFTTLNIPGNVENQAYAINAEGVIVGATYNPAGTTYGDGFIYNHGKFTFYDYPGAVYTQLDGISDGGLMVGIYENEDGTYGAFTLTPN